MPARKRIIVLATVELIDIDTSIKEVVSRSSNEKVVSILTIDIVGVRIAVDRIIV